MSIDPDLIAALPFELQAELSENTFRKDFTWSEIAELYRRCEPVLRTQAKKNQAIAGPSSGRGAKRTDGGKFPQAVRGKTRDTFGALVGLSGRTVEKIVELCEAAEVEPEKFGKLKEDMDRTGRVEGPYKRLVVARKADFIKKEPPPLPGKGPYRVIVADPPWPYEKRQTDPSHRGTYSYPPMSVAQICDLDVKSLAHEDSILWLWVTNQHMREAFAVLDAWAFEQKTILTWVKDKMGMGDWLRGQSEHCLMAVRGKPIVNLTNQTTILHGPVRAHSQKPEEFYALVEKLCPAPRYCELFQRQPRERWDGHGDEVQGGTAASQHAAVDEMSGAAPWPWP